MDAPKLKINDKYIGLRTVATSIYEPKNLKVLGTAIENSLLVNKPLTVIACFQNSASTVLKTLGRLETKLLQEDWNLIVIDNGSTDKTYRLIKRHNSTAKHFIHAKINKVTNRDSLEQICRNYAKPFITPDAYVSFFIDDSVKFEHESIKSFCCVGTHEVKKELAFCIYTIRCFHPEPIYIVADSETREYIQHKFDCSNIFFDISADDSQLEHIKSKYKDQFEKLDNGLHRLDCIFLKMRAMEIALQNESNTLFVDSDIIFTKKVDTPMYTEVVMSPHYWGRNTEYGIYNAGYFFCSSKEVPSTWRDLFLTKSQYCEQGCMDRFNHLFQADIFDIYHNVGFWRVSKPCFDDVYSYHSHLFGQPGDRQDATLSKQRKHAAYIIKSLKTSKEKVHHEMYKTVKSLRFERGNGERFTDLNGKYLSTSWAHNRMGTPITSNPNGKIKLANQTVFQSHRSGWTYAIESLIGIHNDTGVLFDGFLENQFGWTCPTKRYAYDEPWVGVFHNPQNIPSWFFSQYSVENLIKSEHFQESLNNCLGLYALSNYHAEHIKGLVDVPVDVLIHPTEIPNKIFNYDTFINNKDKKIINIGYWLRRLASIYQLPVSGCYTKCRLLPYDADGPKKVINDLIETEMNEYGIEWDEFFNQTKTLDRVSNVEYDNLLSENIIFLDLYDSSANNAVIECIARGTPLLINPIPAVIEYLGADYPFYFNSLDEAAKKVHDFELIKQTHNYLINCDTRKKFSQKYFKQAFISSSIYRSL